MTKRHNTKRTLVLSFLSLLLCFSMLIGTTFAWFTDEVTSNNNIIKAGNLDMTLEYWNGNTWKDVHNSSEVLDKEALWEPGYTEVVYLKLANVGSLAFKYQFGINIVDEKEGTKLDENGNEVKFKLSDYIKFGVKEVSVTNDEPSDFESREKAIEYVSDVVSNISVAYSTTGKLYAKEDTNKPAGAKSDVYVALVVYMPESVGNEANYLTGTEAPEIHLGINAFATQLSYEEDSFDEYYDKESAVFSVADANALMAEGKDATLVNCSDPKGVLEVPANYTGTLTLVNSNVESIQAKGDANVVILGDVTVNAKGTGLVSLAAGESETDGSAIAANGKLTISGKGHLTAIAADQNGAFGIGGMNATDITISDITIDYVSGAYSNYVADTVNDKYLKNPPEGGAAIGSGYNGANITLENVTIAKAIGGSKAAGIGARYWVGVDISITDSNILYVQGGASAAGIGSSRVSNGATESDTTITIENSTITAKGGAYGAGIGSGYDTHCQANQPMCTINITDSTINATGGQYAAGVGTGYHNAALTGEIKNSTVNAVSGDKFYKDTYTQAQDVGFGVTDPAREGQQTDSKLIFNGTEIGIPMVPTNTPEDLSDALSKGENVVLGKDIAFSSDNSMTAPYGNKTAVSHNGGVFDGNGKSISLGFGGDNYVVMTSGGTIKNLNVIEGFRGIMIMDAKETVYIDNVYVGGSTVGYALNTGEGDSTQDLVVTNSQFYGWNSWSLMKSASFTNCTFGQGTYWGATSLYGRLSRPYVDTVFTKCEFNAEGYIIDISSLNGTINLMDCTLNGVLVTADNFDDLVDLTDLASGGETLMAKVMVNGVLVFDEANQ